jgi:hypothetical protein
MHALTRILLLSVPIALTPALGSAQMPECMAAITPQEGIPTGMAAVRITAVLPDDMGAVRSFEAPEDSQLRLADPADIPRVDMANPEEVPRPIVMTPGTNEVTVWLNTIHVTPGTYDIRFGSARGVCMAPLIVTSQG